MVSERMGGAAALREWADKNQRNRRLFYTRIWPRLIPLSMTVDATDAPIAKIEQVIVYADGETRPAPPVIERDDDVNDVEQFEPEDGA